MKIAYCVMCHKYTPVLRELVALVGTEGGGNDVYLHVDAKSDIGEFGEIADKVVFVEPRVDVTWGSWTQIEASLRLLDAARSGECDYIALISGDTLPLRDDDAIKRYLETNRGREFVYELPLQAHHPDRVRYKYPAENPKDRGMAMRIVRGLQKRLRLFPRNPYFGSLPPLAFGSNWLIITPTFRDYIFDYLDSNPSYAEVFRHSHCGDELFFATLINQSPFASRRDPRRYMYVDWQTGPQYPRTLDESDFGRLRAASARDNDKEFYLFARKFSDTLDLDTYNNDLLCI